MRTSNLLMAIFGLLFLVGGTAFIFKSVLDARTEPEWPAFTMIYRIGGSNSSAFKRLTWYGKNHWVSEILENNVVSNSSNSASPVYTGAKYEFLNGTYITFDPNTGTKSNTQIENGVYMSPAEWLFPGYEETLKRSNSFKQMESTNVGNRRYRQEENRVCTKKPNGKPIDPNCQDSQKIITEFTFDPHGIPLTRTISMDGKVLEQYEVIQLTLN